jgi:hypothetical protein
VHLSDIVTACGYYIDKRYLSSGVLADPPLSAYDFGREKPCDTDWEVWRKFWRDYTNPGFRLPVALGPWICSSHRPNEWYHHPTADLIFRRTAGGGQYYRRDNSAGSRLRSQQKFHLLGPAPSIPDLTGYTMVGVERIDDETVNLGATGPDRFDPPAIQHDLLSLLASWGGEWMWERITVHGNLETVVEAYRNGTAIWCTDGSFDRVVMPDVSSAGWTIFDPRTHSHIRASFYEVHSSHQRLNIFMYTGTQMIRCHLRT